MQGTRDEASPARTACHESLSASYPAVPSSLAEMRHAVVAVAAEAGASSGQLDAVRLATSEALTNAVVHAYRDRPGDVHLTVAIAGGELWVLVCDDGDGLRPQGPHGGLGLGLTLIAQACDELLIVKRSNGGTEIRMRFHLDATGRRADVTQTRVDATPTRVDPTRTRVDPTGAQARGQARGSVASATSPALSTFWTTR